MNQELMLRHALEMAIMLPAAFMAFLPVRRHLKLGLLRTFLATGILLILLISLGAAACVQFQVGTSFCSSASLAVMHGDLFPSGGSELSEKTVLFPERCHAVRVFYVILRLSYRSSGT